MAKSRSGGGSWGLRRQQWGTPQEMPTSTPGSAENNRLRTIRDFNRAERAAGQRKPGQGQPVAPSGGVYGGGGVGVFDKEKYAAHGVVRRSGGGRFGGEQKPKITVGPRGAAPSGKRWV